MCKKTVIEQMIGLLRTPIAQRKGINIPPDECLIWAGELEKELKSIPERFNLHPKQEWSEEDEDLLYHTLSNLKELKDRYGKEYGKVGECIDWFKSLRPQNTWKPSEEQISALDFAIDCAVYPEFQDKRKVLIELLEQLKKL